MNIRDLPDFNDMYLNFKATYDFDRSFSEWWREVEEMFVDILGKHQSDWMRVIIGCNWSLSPTAQRILDDNFFDEIRRWRNRALA